MPVEWWGQNCDPRSSSNCYGGSARRAAYVEQKKREFALRNESTFFMDLGGSTFGGPLWEHPDYPRGRPATILQNYLPYDFCLFSPRDFLCNDDEESLRNLAESFGNRTCEFLLANVRFHGLWERFNSQVSPWIVKEMQNGWKVAFIGMMPHLAGYGYNYGPSVISLDEQSILKQIMAGNYTDLKVNGAQLKDDLRRVNADYNQLSDGMHDILLLSSLVPADVLAAHGAAKQAHPDIKASVLLVGDNDRSDQIQWLAEYGDFDVILREYLVQSSTRTGDSEVIQSKVSPKRVLLAGSETVKGIGHIKVRLHATMGLQQEHIEKDIPLDNTVPSNATIAAAMDQLYQATRERNAQPYGVITNPLVGGYHGDAEPPQMNQCTYMDCNMAEVVGRALLWEALRKGYEADVSLYNLGGVRSNLKGNTNSTVYMTHCLNTLQFQNTMKIYDILGRDLYNSIKLLMKPEDRGLISAGIRVAFHEPCFSYVNHSNFRWDQRGPPGHSDDIAACKSAVGLNDAETQITIIDVEVWKVDWARCRAANILTDCPYAEWRKLEKGTMYTLVSTDYLSGTLVGFLPREVAIATDAVALCNYIQANSPLQVGSWELYRQRGSRQYAVAEDGWSQGMRVVSVATATSRIESAPNCPEGMQLETSSSRSCTPCPRGESTMLVPGRCTSCPQGFYSEVQGAALCTVCSAGFHSSTEGSSACSPCGAGTYSDAGARDCIPCPAGQYSSSNASSKCSSCDIGRFSGNSGSSECTPCGADLVTQYPAATSVDQCICPEGTYRPLGAVSAGNASSTSNASAGSSCLPCKEGMTCPLGSDMRFMGRTRQGLLQFPYLLPRHWSSLEDPLSVYECRSARKCPGGDPGSACGPLLMGQACEMCEGSRYWNGNECRSCLDSPFLFPVVPIALVPVIVTIMYFTSLDPLAKWNSWKGAAAVLLFITLNHYQIISLMQSVSIVIPTEVQSTFEFWEWSTDLTYVFNANCIGFKSFTSRTIRASVVPIVVVAMAILTGLASWLLARQTGKEKIRMQVAGVHNVIGSLLFTFFGGIAKQALTLFRCQDNPNGRKTLTEDAGVDCFESAVWSDMLILGIFSVLVYCVAIGSLFIRAVLIAHHHHNFQDPNFQWKWKFLFVKFRADVYWFGVVFLFKNIFVNLAFIAASGDVTQILWIQSVVLFYTALMVLYMPFRYRVANILELVSSISLIYCCSYYIWFSDRTNQQALNILPIAMIFTSFVPVALVTPCTLVAVRTYACKDALNNNARSLFQRVKSSCAALVYMDDDIGGSMLLDLGEWDRLEMQVFCSIVQSEVLGHGGLRLATGAIRDKCAQAVEHSKEVFEHTASILEHEEGISVLRTASTNRDSIQKTSNAAEREGTGFSRTLLEREGTGWQALRV